MKEGIHPNYREVCFVDLSNGFKFVTRSCAQTRETVKMDVGRPCREVPQQVQGGSQALMLMLPAPGSRATPASRQPATAVLPFFMPLPTCAGSLHRALAARLCPGWP